MNIYFHYRWAEKLDQLTDTATKDPEGFLGHPVNAFKLMKRLNTEWGELESLVLKDMSDGEYAHSKSNDHITIEFTGPCLSQVML